MNPQIHKGNAGEDGSGFRGWFVGDLKSWARDSAEIQALAASGLRSSEKVEIKWGVHPAGQARPGGWAAVTEKICVSILLQGRFVFKFRTAGQTNTEGEHLLERQGDYVIWRETVEHTWQAEEASLVLTLRWVE